MPQPMPTEYYSDGPSGSKPKCAGARREKKVGFIVRVHAQHSDLCELHEGVRVAERCIPIGSEHFVNDLAICLDIDRGAAAALVDKYGLLAPEEWQGPGAPDTHQPRHIVRNERGGVVSVPREMYGRIIEARAAEFAGLVRDGILRASGPGRAQTRPVLRSGAMWGLDRLVEGGALWRERLPSECAGSDGLAVERTR